jgi:selenocysteine-specific elongation factor
MAHIQTLSPIEPGKEGMARIRCDRKVPLLPGGHFLLRGPMTAQWGGIVGGGLIVDAHPPLRRKRHTREALFNAENPIDIILEESGDTGLTPQEILSRIGQRHEGEKRYFHPIAVQKHKDNIASKLKSFHKKNPNEPGIASSMFRQTPIAEHVISQLIALRVVIQTGDAIHLATFIPPDEEGLKKEATLLLNYIASAKFTPETIKELYKNAPAGKFPINKTVQYLSSQKSIIKAGDFFITKEHLDRLSKMAATAVTHGEELAIQWLKERTGASRKHAIPIFEYLDRIGVTARNGNVRQAGPNVKEWT